jgi:glycerol-3-phosphate O-acyltransferase
MNPSRTAYDYILPDMRDWPIYRLSQVRGEFVQEVEDTAVRAILEQRRKDGLADDIALVLYMERQRIKEDPWSVDPPDEERFWKEIRRTLVEKTLDKPEDDAVRAANAEMVRRVVNRYANEIMGSFRVSTYRLARRVLTFGFRTMLNAATPRSLRRLIGGERLMAEKVKIEGPIEHIRALAQQGTLMLTPTHFSNLDSVLIGWAADRVGLPAFSYGAGLNLYNNRLFGYFFRRLGAYTLDRRKKNSFYLETIKTFSRLTLRRGVHTLFFPGGTRSRSGQLEKKLKMGLLGSAIDAQCDRFVEGSDQKIFVVPLVINYHFVLEAKGLIQQHLSATGKEQYLIDKKPFGGFLGFFRFFWQLFSVSSEIVLRFGEPLDVLGNKVDEIGQSLDQFGDPVELRDYFVSDGMLKHDRQRNEQYTQRLADVLVRRFYAENVVLTSHLLAHTAFSVFQKRHPNLDHYGILRLPEEDWCIPEETFREALAKAIETLLEKSARGELRLSYPIIHGTLDDVLKHGLQNLGVYHPKRTLYRDKKGFFRTEDMLLLYFYHNRMQGYS